MHSLMPLFMQACMKQTCHELTMQGDFKHLAPGRFELQIQLRPQDRRHICSEKCTTCTVKYSVSMQSQQVCDLPLTV